VLERMLEPEDYAYARREIDLTASACMVGEAGRARQALLFVSPVVREGDDPRAPELPAGLQARLTGIALDPSFVELVLAPFWIPTAVLARLRPSELRDIAEALANGLEPPIQPAAPAERDVCLLGLTLPMAPREEDGEDEASHDRLDAWLAVVADAAGGGRAEPPLALARALDLLRRVKLAVPDEPLDDEEDEFDEDGRDDDDVEVSEALLDALVGHLGELGSGHALLVGEEDGVMALRIAGGVIEAEPEALRDALADALLGSGLLFVVPAARPGAPDRGYAFVLEEGQAEGLSAADAAAAFADEAPADWSAAPAGWLDAPALDYDPDRD
jgi:hypothetical protein